MLVMVHSYVMTIKLLRKRAKLVTNHKLAAGNGSDALSLLNTPTLQQQQLRHKNSATMSQESACSKSASTSSSSKFAEARQQKLQSPVLSSISGSAQSMTDDTQPARKQVVAREGLRESTAQLDSSNKLDGRASAAAQRTQQLANSADAAAAASANRGVQTSALNQNNQKAFDYHYCRCLNKARAKADSAANCRNSDTKSKPGKHCRARACDPSAADEGLRVRCHTNARQSCCHGCKHRLRHQRRRDCSCKLAAAKKKAANSNDNDEGATQDKQRRRKCNPRCLLSTQICGKHALLMLKQHRGPNLRR